MDVKGEGSLTPMVHFQYPRANPAPTDSRSGWEAPSPGRDMAKPQWVQPVLDHGAISAASIEVRWVYGVGWTGTCSVRQEGSGQWGLIEVSKLTEGDAEDLEVWMRLVCRFIGGY